MRKYIVISFALAAALFAQADGDVSAEEGVAVVVAPSSGHRIDRLEILVAIYRRKKQYWDDGQRIEPVNLPADDPLRQRFSQRVLGLLPQQLETYWNDMYFHGVLPPHILASSEAVLRFVSTTPVAIGYVPLCSADSRVAIAAVIDDQGRFIGKPLQTGCGH